MSLDDLQGRSSQGAEPLVRRVDRASPLVDARLPDGSRVNAIIPPLALDGPVLSIRRFGADITVKELVESELVLPAASVARAVTV